MPPGWATWMQSHFPQKDARIRHSLVRFLLPFFLFISIIPLALFELQHNLQARRQLEADFASQAERLQTNEMNQLSGFVTLRTDLIDQMIAGKSISNLLNDLISAQAGSPDFINAKKALSDNLSSTPAGSGKYFDGVIIIDPQGSVLFSAGRRWEGAGVSGISLNVEPFQSLVKKNQAVFIPPDPSNESGGPILYITRLLIDAQGSKLAVFIATTPTDQIAQVLQTSQAFRPELTSYLFFGQGNLFTSANQGNQLISVQEPDLSTKLISLASGSSAGNTQIKANSSKDGELTAFAQWIPEYQAGIMLAEPRQAIIKQSQRVTQTDLFVIGGTLFLVSVLIYFGSLRWIITPLKELEKTAGRFSKGSWRERAPVARQDEIGVLANSLNTLAEKWSDLSSSFDTAIQKRTSQMRVSAEVAQITAATPRQLNTLEHAARLIAERLSLYFVAIYLTDETGQFLILREASGKSSDQVKQRGTRVEISMATLVTWVARYSQPRASSPEGNDALFRPDELLPETRLELAVPISQGGKLLGVLDLHSSQAEVFDHETVAFFQALANQIATAIHNSRLLETSQIGFQESALLYRFTRQVMQAQSEGQLIQAMMDSFPQLPFVSVLLSFEVDILKIVFITDPKTGRIDKSLQNYAIQAGNMVGPLTEYRTILIDDLARPSEYGNLLSFLKRRECRSAALIAILENGQMKKLLMLGAQDATQLNETNLQPFANLAEVIGSSLEKFHAFEMLQKRVSELQILAGFSQTISAETELNQLFRILHQQVTQTFGANLEFAVALYDQRENIIQFPYFFEQGQLLSIPPFPLGEGLTSILIQSRKPLLLPDQQAVTARTGKVIGKDAKSWLGIPLIFSESIVGAVLIQDLDQENRFTEEDVNLLNMLAPQIATAVRNAELYTEAQEALQAYEQERFLLNNLMDSIPEEVAFKDPRGQYIRASKSMAYSFHLTPEEMIAKTDLDLTGSPEGQAYLDADLAVMYSGVAETGKIENLTTSDGQVTWTHLSRIPVYQLDGNLYGLLTIRRDVTELKQAQELAQHRANQVTLAAEIARDATGTLDIPSLLHNSVQLIRQRFGFYHAAIFLVDPGEEYIVLRESAGLAGRQVLTTGYRLAIGSRSIIGQAAGTGYPLIVSDVTKDEIYLADPLLPDTRSELAIPLKIEERVLGVLDVQSTQKNAFQPDDISVLQILADQLAVAVSNADLFTKTQELLNKHRLLRQISISASSSTNLEMALFNVVSGLLSAHVSEQIAILLSDEEQRLQVRASAGYASTHELENQIMSGHSTAGEAAREKLAIRVDDRQADPRYLSVDNHTRSELAIPILFGDRLTGVLFLESPETAAFDENDQEILGALGSTLGGVIENIRLVNRVQQQVLRERQLFEITNKIRHSVNLETILETSTAEISRLLGARRVSIQITAGKSPAHFSPSLLDNKSINEFTSDEEVEK
jgi:PAS domain S-box-containing protein